MDARFRLTGIVGGALLVAIIVYVRFCGALSLPPKPPPPTGPSGNERQLLVSSIGSPAVYQSFLERDAQTAGVRVPSLENMGRKLPYRVDEARHSLDPGQSAPLDVAGLRLHVERRGDVLVLVIQNTIDAPLAYDVVTTPTIGLASCNSATPLPFDANVISPGAIVTRVECVWRDRMSLAVTKAETLELSPLEAWYLDQVPPDVLGVDPRVAKGHRGGNEHCTPMVSAVIRGLEDQGTITWRDLADFYARHRCETYQFPSFYRAFKTDNERPLPVSGEGS